MAAPPITTSVTELPESRVRVEAEVPAAEVEKRVEQAARSLARSIRVPGFRAGKAPAPVVIKRVGREAVLDEAVRDSIGAWYSAAIDAAAIVPVGEPELDLGELPAAGPAADVLDRDRRAPDGDARRVQGARRREGRRAASDEAVEAEVERLRERSGRLETVEREAGEGDFVVMDYKGTLDGEAVRRRRGPRPDDRARLRPARARLRGAADRREGGRRADGRR